MTDHRIPNTNILIWWVLNWSSLPFSLLFSVNFEIYFNRDADFTHGWQGWCWCSSSAYRGQKIGRIPCFPLRQPLSQLPLSIYLHAQIEFPSILLPPSISSGSIVDITVARNTNSENLARKAFQGLQSAILETYGQHSPSPPVLRCRNATQTSIVLEWDPIELATADLRSLSLYRNGSKAGNIPRPLENTATKISGLAVDTEYVFHLVLRTSAGQYISERLAVRTHKMTDLSGITVTPGVLPAPLRESLSGAVSRIGARMADTVRIDTTHFVCTEGRGREWEKAVESNIPVVRPEWIEGCERDGRIVGVRSYYLNADPRLRQAGQGVGQNRLPQPQQQPQPPRNPPEPQPSSQQAHIPTQPAFTPPSSAAPDSNYPHESTTSPPSDPEPIDDHAPPPPAKDTPEQPHTSISQVSDDSSEESKTAAKSSTRTPGLPHRSQELRPNEVATDEKARSEKEGGDFSDIAL